MTPQLQDGRDLGLFVPSEIDDYGLDVYEFRIYSRLARRAGKGQAWESISNMATACQMSERKAKEALKVLLGVGLVAKDYRRGQTSVYQLTPKDQWADPKQLPEIRRGSLKRSQPRSLGSTEPRSTVPGYEGTGFPGNSPPRSLGSTEPRSQGSTKVLPVEGTPMEGTPTQESVRASSASPSEPANQTPPASVLPCQPHSAEEPKHSAPDQGSAAPLQNFSKIEKPRDHFAERCQHPGHKYPQLMQIGLGHIWVGPGWSDFLPELVEACCRHLKKVQRPCEYGDGQGYLIKRIQEANWGAIELRLQEMQQYLSRKASAQQVAIAPPPAEPSIQQFHQPTEPEASERDAIQARINAAIACGQRVNPVTIQRAKELGIEINSLEFQVVSGSKGIGVSDSLAIPVTESKPPVIPSTPEQSAIAPPPSSNFAELRNILPIRSAPTFVNPNFDLGDWEDAV